jgi:hypothetical protein
MKKEDAILFINSGKILGAQLDSGPDYIGWLSVTKQFANQRLLDIYVNEPHSPVYMKEELIREKPYLIHVQELRRTVFESDVWPTNEDYRRNDIFRLYNLYEVEEILQSLGKEFTDLKWPVDYTHF